MDWESQTPVSDAPWEVYADADAFEANVDEFEAAF
jgi:hypothetical protein